MIKQVWDQQCVNNCKCCKDELCGTGVYGWTNVCLTGCVDGQRGSRCYELCQNENCKSCGGTAQLNMCTECYDGYYLGQNNDCIEQCPSSCKSCTSNTTCTNCKEGFHDENGSTTCQYADCLTNCVCDTGQTYCASCKNGFYGTPTSCNKQCPLNCESERFM